MAPQSSMSSSSSGFGAWQKCPDRWTRIRSLRGTKFKLAVTWRSNSECSSLSMIMLDLTRTWSWADVSAASPERLFSKIVRIKRRLVSKMSMLRARSAVEIGRPANFSSSLRKSSILPNTCGNAQSSLIDDINWPK